MSKANKMLEALSKVPRLRLVEPEAVMLGGAEARFDAWQNPLTGLGTDRDKTAYSQFIGDRLLMDGELSAIYHGSDLAGRMVDIVPDEMLREGFTVDVGDPKANTELADQFEALALDDKLADAIRWGRLYGGGGLLLGADDGKSAATALEPERAKALTYLYVFDRRYLWPLTYYRDAGHPKLGQAETYMVTSPSFNVDAPVSVVHESRLVLFGGATTGIRERDANAGWDYSILQRATKVLADFDLGWGAASVLLADGNQAVFKISGLAEALSQAAAGGGGGEAFLRERLKLMDMGRSVLRAVVVDAGGGEDEPEESFERQVFPMTGIPDVLEKLMVRLAATVDVPVTRLFGISPAGLNATGESDVRGWYDRIRSQQTRKLAPKIRRIVRVMMQTKAVKREAVAINVGFPSLWSESPNQAATTRKITIEGDAAAVQAGILLPEEAALQRFKPDGFRSEITLTEEGRRAREAALGGELSGMVPEESGTTPDVELAPTDVAAVLSVNEMRATQKFGPLKLEDGTDDPDGRMSVAAFKAKAAPAAPAAPGRPPFGAPGPSPQPPTAPPEKTTP
jgi:phage-related protein (TIGR01555 family)